MLWSPNFNKKRRFWRGEGDPTRLAGRCVEEEVCRMRRSIAASNVAAAPPSLTPPVCGLSWPNEVLTALKVHSISSDSAVGATQPVEKNSKRMRAAVIAKGLADACTIKVLARGSLLSRHASECRTIHSPLLTWTPERKLQSLCAAIYLRPCQKLESRCPRSRVR
jgi:hypothetical protein